MSSKWTLSVLYLHYTRAQIEVAKATGHFIISIFFLGGGGMAEEKGKRSER